MFDPLIDYTSLDRRQSIAARQQEAAAYDAMFEADGSEAEIDIPVSGGGLLQTLLIPEKPRARAQEGGDGPPGTGSPARSVDIFLGPRILFDLLPRMGGRTLKYRGLTYTISYAKPREVSGVPYMVELHVDPNEGQYGPAPMGGLL